MDENPTPPEFHNSAPNQPQPAEETGQSSTGRRNRVQDLFVWKSLNRPAWSYSKDVYTTLGAVAILISIIFAFFQEWMAILVTAAAYFLFYALSKALPVEVEHKITTEGIISINRGYLWSELGPFWFTQKGKDLLLHVAHRSIFGQLILLVDASEKEEIRDILAEYLPFIEMPEKSMSEKMSEWFSKKFPIEKMVQRNFKAPVETPPVPPTPPQTTSTI